MGRPADWVALVPKQLGPLPWREVESEIGRRRLDAQYSAVWRALLELFVPIGRALGPVFRFVLRKRANALRAAPAVESGPEAARVALEAAFQVPPLPRVGRRYG